MPWNVFISNVKRPFEGYDGFRLYVANALLIASLGILTLLHRHHKFTFIFVTYILAYWTTGFIHLVTGVSIIVFYIALFWLDIARYTYFRWFGVVYLHPGPVAFQRLVSLSAIFSCCGVITVLPFVELHFPAIWEEIWALLAFLTVPLHYALLFIGHATHQRGIGRSRWFGKHPLYFNAAEVAPYSDEALREVRRCGEFCQRGDPATSAFMLNGHSSADVLWDGLDSFFRRLAELFHVAPNRLTVHTGTVDALKFALQESIRVLRRERNMRPLVAYTDAEHESVIEMLHEFESRGEIRLVLVTIQDLIWSYGRPEQIIAAIAKCCLENRPGILLFSHVCYSSGMVLDPVLVRQQLSSHAIEAIFIVDGAQAVGNVAIAPEVFSLSEYYAACAHRWLLGASQPRLGLLIRSQDLIRSKYAFDDFGLPNLPFSYYPVETATFDSRVPYSAYFYLNVAIKKYWAKSGLSDVATHNAQLARLLRSGLVQIGRGIYCVDTYCSIVCFRLADARSLKTKLERKGVSCGLISRDIIRFSLHGYHCDRDVLNLVRIVGDELETLEDLRVQPEEARV